MTSQIPTPDELDRLAEVDSEMEGALKYMPPNRLAHLEPEEMIKTMRAGLDSLEPPSPNPAVREQQWSYTTRDQTTLRICVYKPAGAAESLPLVVWYHGGGACIGRPEMNAELLRIIASKQQCVVMAPQYRLAPEHKYPTHVQDAWDALQHIATHSQRFGADPPLGFLVGGESAGSVLASLMCLQARDKQLNPPITGAFLSAGSYLNPNDIPEQYQPFWRARDTEACFLSPMLSKWSRAAFDACLQPDYSSPSYRAALPENDHTGLPRTYFQACGMDVLRDDTFIYHQILQDSGVETKLDVYPGAPHCFWFMFGDTKLGRKWKADTQSAIEWLLAPSKGYV